MTRLVGRLCLFLVVIVFSLPVQSGDSTDDQLKKIQELAERQMKTAEKAAGIIKSIGESSLFKMLADMNQQVQEDKKSQIQMLDS